MMAMNRAPGLERRFAFETFDWYDHVHLGQVREEANNLGFAYEEGKYCIVGSDVDGEMIVTARENAEAA